MARFAISFVIALIIGIVTGLAVGWELAPTEYVNGPVQRLAQRYKDDYTVMIAAGYLEDADPNAAVGRLRALGVENVPLYVQETTERYITNSRDLDDIRLLVTLSEGLGRLTPIMEPYRMLDLPELEQ